MPACTLLRTGETTTFPGGQCWKGVRRCMRGPEMGAANQHLQKFHMVGGRPTGDRCSVASLQDGEVGQSIELGHGFIIQNNYI